MNLSRALPVAAVLFGMAIASQAAEGFGDPKKIVGIARMNPPQRVLPIKRFKFVFSDQTHRADALRKQIESDIHAGDPQMVVADDGPYVMTVVVTEYQAKPRVWHSIHGTYRIADRADRDIYAGDLTLTNDDSFEPLSDAQFLAKAASFVVSAIASTREENGVVLPKGRLEPLIPLAQRGDWPAYLSAVERLPRLAGEDEAYRQYAFAIAHEAMAYRSPDLESAVRHLREAIVRNIAAAHTKPSEDLFSLNFTTLVAGDRHATPPKFWVSPSRMETWESMLLIQKWMAAPAAAGSTLDNQSVLNLAAAGRTDQAIIARIRRAGKVRFALGQSEMKALRKAGVSLEIVATMRSKAGLQPESVSVPAGDWQ
jgi:hypothetical protein